MLEIKKLHLTLVVWSCEYRFDLGSDLITDTNNLIDTYQMVPIIWTISNLQNDFYMMMYHIIWSI